MKGCDTKAIFLLPLILLITLSVSNSQKGTPDFPFPRVEYYTPAQGLNGNDIASITQDHHGFMWFLTEYALNRYDGYSFRSYGYREFNTTNLSLGNYYGIAEDKEGKLWIPSYQSGLDVFDPLREKFMHHDPIRLDTNNGNTKRIQYVVCGNDGYAWTTTSSGLDKFDPVTQQSTHFKILHADTSRPEFNTITCILMDPDANDLESQEKLWIIHDGHGIDLFNTRTGKVTHHFHYTDHPPKWEWGNALGIQNGMIWIGSDLQVILGFDTKSNQYVRIPVNEIPKSKNKTVGAHFVIEDHSGNLWTTNDQDEIVYYDRINHIFHFLPVQLPNLFFDQFHSLLYEDKSGRIWVGTTQGLISIDTKYKKINSFQQDEQDPKSISSNFIGDICQIKQDQLLIGSIPLRVFKKEEQSFSETPCGNSEILSKANGAMDFSQDSKGIVWMTGGGFGIISYDPINCTVRHHILHTDSEVLSEVLFLSVLEDSKGRYWTPGWGKGLFAFDPATNKARHFKVSQDSHSISSHNLANLFQDSRGTIYMCGWEDGFITFNPDSEKFKIYHHDSTDLESVSSESNAFFRESKNGLIWFGTFGGGINVFDPKTEKFKAFTTRDGLAHNSISSLTEDKNGNYWVGTRGGLSRFKPPEDPFSPNCKIEFRNYDTSDGLPVNETNLGSAFCDSDGTMYFGTRSAGIFYFHPDDLTDNAFIPPVFITDFYILNKPVHVNDSNSVIPFSIAFTKEINLHYRQNMISFSFTALNFISPEKNKYAYMLDGADEDWIHTDASKRFASYSNLAPGHYTFKVKGSNNDGIWNETPTELSIYIHPPFWQTTWFRILIAITVMGIAYSLYRYRIRQILVLQAIRNKIASDLHDDIGSTLNSISVYSEVATRDAGRRDHALKMIGESSRKIIDSMSDIVWTINPQNDSFDKIIFRMSSLSYNLLKAKEIDCIFKADESLNNITLPMETRKNFYLIFKEALNNLVKYSNATRATVMLSHENKSVSLVLRDNGKGFDSSASYNGNGIKNMKKRAEEINAQLSIESADGSGTCIELNLKI